MPAGTPESLSTDVYCPQRAGSEYSAFQQVQTIRSVAGGSPLRLTRSCILISAQSPANHGKECTILPFSSHYFGLLDLRSVDDMLDKPAQGYAVPDDR